MQYKGQALNQASTPGSPRPKARTTDYGFHLIVTDMPDERLPELKTMIDQGVTSFKLFMAYPGSSWWTTA